MVEVFWKNYFGDAGSLQVGPYKTVAKTSNKFVEIEIQNMEKEILVLEQPKMCRFRLHNLTDKIMNISVQAIENQQGDCVITEIEPSGVFQLPQKSFADIMIQLFPKSCGVVHVSGLQIYDSINKKVMTYSEAFAKFTV